jgi:flagellin-specific chaperone FliS
MLAAFQSVATHDGVGGTDPRRLVPMLKDGALERIAQATGSLTHGVACITEVPRSLLGELRSAWIAIGPQAPEASHALAIS